MLEQAAGSYFDALTAAFVDPGKRLFLGYLGSALVIALVWLTWFKGRSLAQACGEVFNRESWWSRSARADYRVMALNSAIMLVLSPRLLSQLGVSIFVFEWMHGAFQGRPGPPPAHFDWVVMMAFTLCLFVLDDFSRYVVHRLLHRVPFLWSFHKVHHTATSLNPLTVYRTHPVEGVLFVLRSAVVHGSCTAVFVFFFANQVSLATVLGAAVFNFAFNALGANLRHSHVALGFWRPVERVFISPAQHQVHHSLARRHVDRNFGAALAIWDVAFRTHCHSEADETLRFGVKGEPPDRVHTLAALYWRPFTEGGRAVWRSGARFLRAGATRPRVQSPGAR
ncbi:MAG: sterol desaturase family protein [Gammaproteobacteria bacterium]|nr:sterol desaturase family protein [Gammaproteobacteria bacterium]